MRSAFFATLALPGALFISACAVGPRVTGGSAPVAARQPDSLTSAASRSFLDSLTRARVQDSGGPVTPLLERGAPLALDSTGDVAWLSILKDTNVVALVETAVANNRDLRGAVARVREYRASLGAARGDFFPQISANGAASTNKAVFGAFPPQNYDAFRVTADLAWELDFWGRIRRQAQAAAFDWRGRDADRRAAVVSLVSDVVQSYLDLRGLDAELAIAERTLESRKSTLNLARQRFRQGVISELDVRQFEAEVAAPAANVADFSRQRAQKEHALSVLLGQTPGPIARGLPLEEAVRAIQVPDSLPGSLLLRRPDVLAAEADWKAATARIGVTLATRLPRFSVTAQYGSQSPDLSGLFGSNTELYSLQGSVSIPLFTGGRLINQQRAARARADQAQARYEQALLGAAQEASDALVGLRMSRDQLAAQATQVQALRRAYELATRRYESGVSSYLEVLDAQRGLFAAELGLVQVQRQYLGATVQLYKAIGGGWSESR
jgi:multidrug efflux system outer membrane protein